jgi:hypothetical protein
VPSNAQVFKNTVAWYSYHFFSHRRHAEPPAVKGPKTAHRGPCYISSFFKTVNQPRVATTIDKTIIFCYS